MKRACNPDGPVYVKDVLVGFDMPFMGISHRDLKLNLTAATSISYDGDGSVSCNFCSEVTPQSRE